MAEAQKPLPTSLTAPPSPTPVERFLSPFQEFAHNSASGGILLIVCTVIALVWANSGWAASYTSLFSTTLTVGFGDGVISKPLILWINDGLMAIFFFVVGLEIKREILVGELSSPRAAALPVRKASSVGMPARTAHPSSLLASSTRRSSTVVPWA